MIPLTAPTRGTLRNSRNAFPNELERTKTKNTYHTTRLPRGSLDATCIRNIVPSTNKGIYTIRRVFNPNKGLPYRLTKYIVTRLPTLTRRLRIRITTTRNKMGRPNTTVKELPRLRVNVDTTRILCLSNRRRKEVIFLYKRNAIRLFGVTTNVRDKSPL